MTSGRLGHVASSSGRVTQAPRGDLVLPVERELAVGREVLEQRRDVARVELARVERHRATGGSSCRSIVTPPCSTTSPGTVSSQLPPVSAARSTITEPGRMRSTALAGISFGAGRPGTAAVVITTSKSGIRSSSAACCCACSSGVSSRRVAALGLLARGRRARGTPRRGSRPAPSRPAARRTRRRRRRAGARSRSPAGPATPAPITSARTGAIVPAAVISIGKSFGTRSAARSDGLVAGDGRLRRERVHRLRARDARDRLHRERDDARARGAARCPPCR